MTGMPPEFTGKRILVVEAGDSITEALRQQLAPHGATVLGPMLSISATIALIEIGSLDAAILDIELETESSFFIAEALEQQSIPFLFVTDGIGAKWQGYELGRPSSLQMIGQALFGSTFH